MRNALVLCLTAVLTTIAAPASAAPLTFTLDPTVAGLTFTVENKGLADSDLDTSDGTTDTYKILLTLNTSTSYTNVGSAADLLAAFSLDLSDGDLDDAELFNKPAGFEWKLFEGNKVTGNAAKCTGEEEGALCVEEVASALDNLVLDANQAYEWLFLVDIGDAGFADQTGMSVGIGTLKVTGPNYSYQGTRSPTGTAGSLALAVNGTGELPGPGDGDAVTAAPVPEPGSLVLLGSGLLLAASRMRRRR